MNFSLAEDFAVIAVNRYPRHQEPVGLGAAAKKQRDRIPTAMRAGKRM
jgi:hypothetical protein